MPSRAWRQKCGLTESHLGIYSSARIAKTFRCGPLLYIVSRRGSSRAVNDLTPNPQNSETSSVLAREGIVVAELSAQRSRSHMLNFCVQGTWVARKSNGCPPPIDLWGKKAVLVGFHTRLPLLCRRQTLAEGFAHMRGTQRGNVWVHVCLLPSGPFGTHGRFAARGEFTRGHTWETFHNKKRWLLLRFVPYWFVSREEELIE